MSRIFLNIRAAGCPNHCFHCHSCGGSSIKSFLDIDTIRKVGSYFREKLDADASVLLLDEQSYYTDFISLVEALEADGFMRKDSSKMLVTNCWGLKNNPELTDKLKDHYSIISPTLFGIGQTHDRLAGRKGSYDDIIESTKAGIEKGLDFIWHLQWSRQNTEELDSLYELGESLGVHEIFISADYSFTGYFPEHADDYLPILDDIGRIRHEIYELQQGYLKTAGQFLEDIQNGIVYDIKKAALDHLYIDENLNVYPFLHRAESFLLGNLNDPSNKIIEQIKSGLYLPEAIVKKREQDFSELVVKYADRTSRLLYTPQSLFDKLCYRK